MSVGNSSTELKRVRGLGSAREGGEHWIGERVSSVALLFLGAWLIASLLFLAVGGAALALFALGKIAFGGAA